MPIDTPVESWFKKDFNLHTYIRVIQVRRDQGLEVKIRCPMKVLITRRQSIFDFYCKSRQRRASEGRCWLVLDAEASLCLDLQRNKTFV